MSKEKFIVDMSGLELIEDLDLASDSIEYDLFNNNNLDPRDILVNVPEGLEEAIEVVADYIVFLERVVEEA